MFKSPLKTYLIQIDEHNRCITPEAKKDDTNLNRLPPVYNFITWDLPDLKSPHCLPGWTVMCMMSSAGPVRHVVMSTRRKRRLLGLLKRGSGQPHHLTHAVVHLTDDSLIKF